MHKLFAHAHALGILRPVSTALKVSLPNHDDDDDNQYFFHDFLITYLHDMITYTPPTFVITIALSVLFSPSLSF